MVNHVIKIKWSMAPMTPILTCNDKVQKKKNLSQTTEAVNMKMIQQFN